MPVRNVKFLLNTKMPKQCTQMCTVYRSSAARLYKQQACYSAYIAHKTPLENTSTEKAITTIKFAFEDVIPFGFDSLDLRHSIREDHEYVADEFSSVASRVTQLGMGILE